MRVQYFEDTDTLYIAFRESEITETRDFDENALMDLDAHGNVCALTFEHAGERTDVDRVRLEGIAV